MADKAPLSTIQDFKEHWLAMPEDRTAEATRKIEEASIEVRGNYPTVDERVAAGSLDEEVVRLVVNRMVKRAMDNPIEEHVGVQSATAQTGPFATTLNFANPDGNIYMSKADHRLLRGPQSAKQAFSIFPGGVGRVGSA